MKKVLLFAVVVVLVIPLVIVGSGNTSIWHQISTTDAWTVVDNTTAIGSVIPATNYERLVTINEGATFVTTEVAAQNNNFNKTESVLLTPGAMCDPFKQEILAYGDGYEALQVMSTWYEGNQGVDNLYWYSKGGSGSSNTVIQSDGAISESGFKAIAVKCTNLDERYPNDLNIPDLTPPVPPQKPVCPPPCP